MVVLVITGHDVWGNLKEFSPLKNLLLTLGEAGHRVAFLTNTKVNENATFLYGPPVEKFHKNVFVRRFQLPGDNCVLPLIRRIPVLRSIWNRLRMEVVFCIMAFVYGIGYMRSTRVDMVYGYEIFGALPAFLLSKLFRRKLVLRYQGTLLSFQFEKARTGTLSKLNLIRYVFHMVALKVPADLIVMTDDGTKGDWVLKKMKNKSPTVFWRNGLDFERTLTVAATKEDLRHALNLPENASILLSVNRLAVWKRLDRIFRAVPHISQRVPEFMYICVGDGELMESLRAMSAELGISKRVLFAGKVAHSEVIEYMHAADVFISMNDWSNAGNPIMEAMICGLPIVAYDSGNTGGLIRSGETGVLLKADDPETVGKAVSDLMTDAALRTTLGTNARAYARSVIWTWEERMDAEIRRLEALASPDQAKGSLSSLRI